MADFRTAYWLEEELARTGYVVWSELSDDDQAELIKLYEECGDIREAVSRWRHS